jgi:hypothetical protein
MALVKFKEKLMSPELSIKGQLQWVFAIVKWDLTETSRIY